MLRKKLFFLFLILSTVFSCAGVLYAPQENFITLNPNTTYQTITGWEATDYAKDWPGHSTTYPAFMNDLLDRIVNEAGINRVRLQVHSGSENPTDYGAQFLNGQITEGQYIHNPGYAYQIVNDNSDPNVINPNGFHFTWLDHKVEDIVLPMKQKLEANGEKLFVNLCVIDFGTATLHSSKPAEYAEFVLAVFQHLESKYNLVPDALEIELEPHHGTWDATELGKALVAAGDRLAANGYHPKFIAPSHTAMSDAVTWFDTMVAIPGVLNYLSEFSYHRYSGVSDTNLQAIGARKVQYGVDTAMLEHIGSTYEDLHKDLKVGLNSAWSLFVLATGGSDPEGGYYGIDESTVPDPTVFISNRTKFFRQYFKFIRAGAVRIGASTSNGNFDPLAFINKNGKYTVVVKANSGGSFEIRGLPAGTYGIKYTTFSEFDRNLNDVTLGQGKILSTNIPGKGVITIYAKTATVPTPPPPPPPPPPGDYQLYMPYLTYGLDDYHERTTEMGVSNSSLVKDSGCHQSW